MQPTFPIVGIGASAGGLKAIEEILLDLPKDTGMAFIIVQHLSRRYKSLMQEILEKDTEMPVVMATHGILIEPDHIYLIPAGYNLTINNGELILEDQSNDTRPYFVIDKFLNSLGQDLQSNAIAVILSGTGSDGSRGIRTIKELGGIVIVQEPNSGEFDGMPQSAIDTLIVDFVLPPKEIANKLTYLSKINFKPAYGNSVIKGLNDGHDHQEKHNIDFENILSLVKKYFEVDFTLYKSKTVKRRIEKHMTNHDIKDLVSYYHFLSGQPSRVEELLEELLIGVTEFFRDKPAYQALRDFVYPRIINEDKDRREVRVWVCACSTGEEVYSLLIDMEEYANAQGYFPKYTVLATDIDEKAIATASKGHYSPSRMANIPETIIDKYFNYNGEKYEVKSYLRDRIIFARNDATTDPPFINLDLVVCRNLLIYLKPIVQRRLLLNFHFGLKLGGLLWLGSSESIGDYKNNFDTLNEKWKIFLTTGETPKNRKNYVFHNPKRNTRTGGASRNVIKKVEDFNVLRNPRVFYAKLLLDKYAHSCAVIDEDFTLQYLAGDGGKYLKLPDMELSNDLLNMVSDETVLVIRDGVRRLLLEKGPLKYPDVNVLQGNHQIQCDIFLENLGNKLDKQLFLIEWHEKTNNPTVHKPTTIIEQVKVDANAHEIIKDLQDELSIARQEVQNSLEELETSNEELQAANEELLASNEELQSTNEELQSVNEELYTVNSELQARNKELTDANSTIDNLLTSTDIGTLFLDLNLYIKFFTPYFKKVIDLVEGDLGISITKFHINWNYPEFIDDVKYVLEKGKSLVKEIQGTDLNTFYSVRLNPYIRTSKLDGVIVTMFDISEQKIIENDLKSAEQNQRRILDAIPMDISIVNTSGKVLYYNRSEYYEQVENGHMSVEQIGKSIFEHLDEPKKVLLNDAFKNSISNRIPTTYENELSGNNGSNRFRNTVIPLEDSSGSIKELLIASINVTEERIISNSDYHHLTQSQYILENSSIIATIKNENMKYVFSNDGLTKFLKKPKQHIIGSNDFALFPEEIARQLRHNDEWVLREKKEFSTIETYSHTEDKVKATVLKFPIFMENERVFIGQVAILFHFGLFNQEDNDADSQSKLEQIVDERTAALIQANQELRTITRSIAHDLRSPLRAINMFGQILDKEFKQNFGKSENEYLDNILRQSSRMGTILDGLLDYVKLGSIEVRKEWIDMKSLVQEVWDDLQYMQEKDVCELIFRNCPPAWGDLALVKQVITNLFSNALKYRKKSQSLTVEFGAHKDHKTKEWAYFIKDNGIGFDPKYAEKIFGVFERLHEATKSEGHGIGLSIVKKSIELQGGTVWATSQMGMGSTFYVSLPGKPPI